MLCFSKRRHLDEKKGVKKRNHRAVALQHRAPLVFKKNVTWKKKGGSKNCHNFRTTFFVLSRFETYGKSVTKIGARKWPHFFRFGETRGHIFDATIIAFLKPRQDKM